MSAAVPSTGLGHQLKIATATMHRRVERTAFMAGLLRGQIERPRYAGLLHNLQALYAALEDALARHASTPGVAPVVMPELFRSRALAADLRVLAGDDALAGAPLARATRKYVERLHELSAAKPGLLVAHAYVRYLGDLNGGQALRRVVAGSLGLAGGAGTLFYDFGDSATQQRLLQRFRAGLETVAAQLKDIQALSDEALSAFERHEQLFEELAAA
ncbi:MAG: biliverdin-producing heme oxygenase [Burkholderiaceae bacterium]|jgi:heme oxygenase|nr:biliverdin-producing heme oxygenase [Burkholderiaceae bacterium]